MTLLKNSRFLISLCWVCMCASSFGAEPNEPKTNIQFEIRSGRPPQTLFRTSFQPPSESTHFAVLFVKGEWDYYRNKPIEAMLETSAGKAMSPKQCDLISNQSIQMCDYGHTISDYSYFRLFGVNEIDTKKMVEAFMAVLENESKAKKQSLLNTQQRLQEKIAQIEKQILQKEKDVKDAENKLGQIKKKVHYLSAEEAKGAVEMLNKTLDELNIEIVGIRVRLEAIAEEHERTRTDALKSNDARRKSYETMIWPRLEQMRIDELIEFKVAEAKKAAATTIRDEAEEFYNLSKQPVEMEKHLSSLRETVSRSQGSLESIERELAKSDQFTMPPKVFQNKVTIYPVLTKRP
jgi:hypothetical protein